MFCLLGITTPGAATQPKQTRQTRQGKTVNILNFGRPDRQTDTDDRMRASPQIEIKNEHVRAKTS